MQLLVGTLSNPGHVGACCKHVGFTGEVRSPLPNFDVVSVEGQMVLPQA